MKLDKKYKRELNKIPMPFQIVGDGLIRKKTHKEIADSIGENVNRVKHLIKVMRKNKEHLPLFKDVL